MKLKTIIHRRVRQAIYRYFRYHPLAELIIQLFAHRTSVLLPGETTPLELRSDDIALDFGANVGDISSQLACTGATVHAFEPDPNAFRVLKRRFALVSRVVCFNKGVMAAQGSLRLYFCNPNAKDRIQASQGSSLMGNKNVGGNSWVDVNCVDVADIFSSIGRDVGFVKMDIEGAEVEVINRMIETGCIYKVRRMVVETHEEQIPALAIKIKHLRDLLNEIGLGERVSLDWQ